MSHVTTNFALYPESLLLGSLGKLSLKRIFLSTVAHFLPFVVTFTLSQSSAFSGLVQANRMILMNLTLRTVRPDFLRNVHVNSLLAFLKENKHALILFPLATATTAFS